MIKSANMNKGAKALRPATPPSAPSAKSFAPRKLHSPKNPPKNLHGGLRCEKRGL